MKELIENFLFGFAVTFDVIAIVIVLKDCIDFLMEKEK
jgi:hypothetical protein